MTYEFDAGMTLTWCLFVSNVYPFVCSYSLGRHQTLVENSPFLLHLAAGQERCEAAVRSPVAKLTRAVRMA